MSTLYELLGALSHDDAEALRAAFRKAVKGAHPDLKPDDPDAALKFREIVRANEILCDSEQRNAYDHLLHLARLEAEAVSKAAPAAKIRKVATAVMAFTGVPAMIIGGYLLFMDLSSSASLASANNVESGTAVPLVAAASPVGSLNGSEKSEGPTEPDTTPVAASVVASSAFTTPTPQRSPPLDPIANAGVGSMQEVQFNHDDDFTMAGVDHPALQPAVIFYRLQKNDGAFAAWPDKPLQQLKSRNAVPRTIRRPRLDQASGTPLAPSIFSPMRKATIDTSREKRRYANR
jgi:curved DNA-binding protein CbpA